MTADSTAMTPDDPETEFLCGSSVSASAPCAALRGMSRKVLAKVSGISERYIAQLESGKGNVSIVLLRRVAHAMGAHARRPHSRRRRLARLAGDPRSRCARRRRSRSRRPRTSSSGHGASRASRNVAFAGIALIGLRGAGKSTLGKMLAEEDRLDLRRAEQGDRAAERTVGRRNPRALRPGRFPPHGAGRAGANCWRARSRWCSRPAAASSPSRSPST